MNAENSWQLMIFMALTLGIRHGFDLDHLATIDALTRTIRDNRILSKMVGCLFSLGHGLVVIGVSLIIGGGLIQTHVPQWLEGFGNWISIFFLVVFGALNLWNVFQQGSASGLPGGIRTFLVKKISGKRATAPLVMMIGALFAFSFDTISQVALFSISASLMSGWVCSGIIGVFFMLGMMISDGLNGLFVSTLVQRADRTSLIVSRTLGLAISMFSLVIGFSGLLKLFSRLFFEKDDFPRLLIRNPTSLVKKQRQLIISDFFIQHGNAHFGKMKCDTRNSHLGARCIYALNLLKHVIYKNDFLRPEGKMRENLF